MVMFSIKPTRENLHGVFSRDLEPVIEIESGDSVAFETLDAAWSLEPMSEDGSFGKRFEQRTERDRGHALCGPVYIAGAQPGMTLAIQIRELKTADWGWNAAGGDPDERRKRLGIADQERRPLRWSLDREAQIATNQFDHRVTMRPFLGVMGMPTDEDGDLPTSPPRVTGGNIDCKELVVGTTLYLPVAVEGGLFSTGDGHAAQGDGEVSGTAIECGMETAELKFTLYDDIRIHSPQAWTPDAWLTFGLDEDLDEAMFNALNGMLDLIENLHNVDRTVALALASTAVDLRITQVVNGVQGVHAMLPHGAIR